MFIQLIKIQIP